MAPVGPGTPSAEEEVGPFSSWSNVRDDRGAVGDGVADDTDALQSALDQLGMPGESPVAYVPSGTYRITRSLVMTEKIAVGFVGDDPETSRIVWDGGADGPMLVADGVTRSRFARLTWDGAGQATIGVAHWWNHERGNYAPTNLTHADEVFVDLGKGIVGGSLEEGYGWNDAEVSIERCRFERCTEAGVSVESWNALDYWIWDSQFESCARRVTNEFGAGNFMVYRSLFRSSSMADVTLQNTQFFSLRGNVSVQSRRFLQAGNMYQNAAPMTVQGNRVLDTILPVSIDVGNTGPLILVDNQIRSAVGATGPVVAMTGSGSGPDLVSIGNRYTVEEPLSVSQADGRSWSLDDEIVDRADIDDTVAGFVGFAPRPEHEVFEVPAGADAAAIQSVIDLASASDDPRPIIHLPAGDYSIAEPLVVPAGRSLQLVGDCWYEGSGSHLFRGDSGTFTWQGGNLAPADPNHGGGPEDASIYLDDFSGRAALLALNLNLAVASNGILVGSESAQTRALLLGLQGNQEGFFQRTSSGGAISLLSSKLYVADQGSMIVPDLGQRDESLIRDALAQTRAMLPSYPSPRPEGATDVRLYRLQTVNVTVGLLVTAD